MRSLEFLSVDGCVKLKKVRGLAQCTKLDTLSVCGCSELEDFEGVEHCTSLRQLIAYRCPQLRWGGGVMAQLHQRLKRGLGIEGI